MFVCGEEYWRGSIHGGEKRPGFVERDGRVWCTDHRVRKGGQDDPE